MHPLSWMGETISYPVTTSGQIPYLSCLVGAISNFVSLAGPCCLRLLKDGRMLVCLKSAEVQLLLEKRPHEIRDLITHSHTSFQTSLLEERSSRK